MTEPTRDDVDLILRLYDFRRDETMRKARRFILGEFYAAGGKDFLDRYPPGSDQNAYFRQVTSYWDMVGAFVKKGLLNADLLFETAGEFHIIWEKVRATVGDLRQMRRNPFYLKNLEELATRHKAFMEGRAPGSSDYYASLNKPIVAAKSLVPAEARSVHAEYEEVRRTRQRRP